MCSDTFNGKCTRVVNDTLCFGRGTLINHTSETITVIEDCGRRTIVRPVISDTSKGKIFVTWDMEDTIEVTDNTAIINTKDFHIVALGLSDRLYVKYIQQLPATVIMGQLDYGLSNSILRDLGRSLDPVCLSEDFNKVGKWIMYGKVYAPVIYQPGSGRITTLKPELVARDMTASEDYLIMDSEELCREKSYGDIASVSVANYCETLANAHFETTRDLHADVRNMVLGEHKVIAEEYKQETSRINSIKVATDAITKIVR